MVLGGAASGQDIQAPADPLQPAGGTETAEVGPGDIVWVKVSRAQDASLPDQFQNFICLCRMGNQNIAMLHNLGENVKIPGKRNAITVAGMSAHNRWARHVRSMRQTVLQ